MGSYRRSICAVIGGLGALLFAPRVDAIVTTIDGATTSQAQEFVTASPGQSPVMGDSDFAFKDLGDTTQTLPLNTLAQLSHFEDSSQDAGARAETMFSDPRTSVTPDPQEFAIDLAAHSQSSRISYSGQCDANETRSVTFLSEEIGSPNGTGLQAESQFFLDGIIMVWGEKGQTDLTGTSANLTLKVEQSGGSLTDPVTVLEAGLNLSGGANGAATLAASGQLQAGNVITLDLTGQIPDLGPVHLLIIPQMAIPYDYNANVGEAFTLKASIQAQIRNQPQTGASVVLGVPLIEVAALVDSITGGNTGATLQQIVQVALNAGSQPSNPLPTTAKGTTVTVQSSTKSFFGLTPGCGAMGMEGLLGMTGLGLLQLMRRRS